MREGNLSADCLPLFKAVRRLKESLRLEEISKIAKSNYHLTLPVPPLNHVPKCHVYTSLKYIPPGMETPAPPRAARSNALPPFL